MKISPLDVTVSIARAIGHPARSRILAMLAGGELCVCQITEVLGLAQSTVSTHLRELKRVGLIQERKDSRWVYFSLADDEESAAWLKVLLFSVEHDQQLAADSERVRELRDVPVEDLCRFGFDDALKKARNESK